MEDSLEAVVGAYGVVALLIGVVFARHLVACLHECSPTVWTVKPWELWLLSCPVIGVLWTLVVLPRLFQTLELEYRNRGLRGPDPSLRRYGGTFAVTQVLSAIPCVAIVSGPFALLNFIWYVQGIAQVTRTLRAAPLEQSPSTIPDGEYALADLLEDTPATDAPLAASSREDLRRAAKSVGLAMTVTAVTCIAVNVILVVGYAVVNRPAPPTEEERREGTSDRDPTLGPVCCLVWVASLVYVPVFRSGLKLWHGRNSESAPLAAMLTLLPASPGVVIGIPVGIWAIIVLHRDGMGEVLRTSVYRPRKS